MKIRLAERWSEFSRGAGIVAALVALCGFQAPARAIEIVEVQWGFDGKVIPKKFNMLSVLVNNPSAEPFDGKMELRMGSSSGARVGAVIEEPLYLSPFSRKWVQFYPYVNEVFETWSLHWGRDVRSAYRINEQLPAGEPARVLFFDSEGIMNRGGGMRRFAENLFPPTVTATDCLHTAVLDHVPRWEEARRVAFRDWIVRGGTVHLLLGTNGEFPRFTAELADLNAPLDSFRVGSGMVYRHARTRDKVDNDFVRQAIFQDQPAAADAEASDNSAEQYASWNQDIVIPDLAMGLFGQLKQMTRPAHNWTVIYLMSLAYMALIFPGCYVLGMKRLDYRIVYGALLAAVVVFSFGFSVVGARGYGEATAVHTVGYAKPLGDGKFDVTAWSNVFVTSGDDYLISHEGTGPLYSTCQDVEAVNGVIKNGAGGRFIVDIPPYSSRTYGHRIKAAAEPFKLEVAEWEQNGLSLARFAATADRDLNELVGRRTVYGLHRDRLYAFKLDGKRLEIAGGAGTPIAAYVGQIDANEFNQYGMYYGAWANETVAEDERFNNMFKSLLVSSLNLNSKKAASTFALPDEVMRLFIYAPLPKSFCIREERFGKQSGYMLYCIDLYRPE